MDMGNSPNILNSLAKLDALCPAGYAMALHINYTTPRFLFQTYNHDWMEYYSKNGLVLKDPTVRWGFQNLGHKLWSELEEEDTEGVLKAAKKFGVDFGFTYSTDSHGSKSISSFARDDRNFSEDEIAEICALTESLHNDTADLTEISEAEQEQLKKMSVEFTHA